MLKKLQKNLKNNSYLIGLVVIAVFAFGLIGYAAYESQSPIDNHDGGVVYIQYGGGELMGNLGVSADFCAGDEPVTNMCVVDIYDLTVAAGGLTITGDSTFSGAITTSGENTLSGTTTIPILDASRTTDLSWAGGTTTPAGGETTVITVAEMTNTGADLFCNDILFDLSTARGSFSGLFAIGTTTDSGDVSLTSTSTASLIAETAVATTTTDYLNKKDESGTNDEEWWIWAHGAIITASDTFTTGNATSAASFTAEGGFTGAGKLHVNCRTRY